MQEDKPTENEICPALEGVEPLKNCRRPEGSKSNEFDFFEILKEPKGELLNSIVVALDTPDRAYGSTGCLVMISGFVRGDN